MQPFKIDLYLIYLHYWNHTHPPLNKTHTCASHASYLATHPSSQPMKETMDYHCQKLVHPRSIRSKTLLWDRLKIFCLHPKRLKSLTSCKWQSKSSTSFDATYSYATTQEVENRQLLTGTWWKGITADTENRSTEKLLPWGIWRTVRTSWSSWISWLILDKVTTRGQLGFKSLEKIEKNTNVVTENTMLPDKINFWEYM